MRVDANNFTLRTEIVEALAGGIDGWHGLQVDWQVDQSYLTLRHRSKSDSQAHGTTAFFARFPFADRWKMMTGVEVIHSQEFSNNKPLMRYFGAEYASCCYSLRIGWQSELYRQIEGTQHDFLQPGVQQRIDLSFDMEFYVGGRNGSRHESEFGSRGRTLRWDTFDWVRQVRQQANPNKAVGCSTQEGA